MNEYQRGDRVRLIRILDPERTRATWSVYIGQEATVISPALPSGLRLIRIQFEDGEWFPAHDREIERV